MRHHEYLVLGAGPAGLQTAFFLKQCGHDYRVLERAAQPGAFFRTYPRHRKLISINKIHTRYDDAEINLRWDWNSLLSKYQGPRFGDISERYFPPADAMVEYLERYSKQHALAIKFGVDIVEIGYRDRFVLRERNGGIWTCDRLIVATGVSIEHKPDIPGIDLCESYGSVSLNPDEFRNARVLIIGKGNSAFETADHLVEHAASIHLVSPNPIRMAWRTHYVGHLRAVNNNLLDTYQLKLQNAVLDATVLGITRRDGEYSVTVAYTYAEGEIETLQYDRIICCTGFCFDDSIFDESARPASTPCRRFPAQTSAWESVNIPHLYFAGTLMQGRAPKMYTSGFVHGFRYNVRTLCRILDSRYHGCAWPTDEVDVHADVLTERILERINRSSALWQQPGFLCDAISLSAHGPGNLHQEMSMDYAREYLTQSGHPYLLVTLEFGPSADDPFAGERVHRRNVQSADASKFLHPIVRYYVRDRLYAEHHIIEDLAGEWREREHIAPLHAFLSTYLGHGEHEREPHVLQHAARSLSESTFTMKGTHHD